MTEKQAAYHRRRSLCRVAALLTSHFEHAQLLALCYTPGPPLPQAIADSQYRALMHRARHLAGGPFPYVKLADYAPSVAQVTAYRLIVDLPAGVCREIADSWFMGKATVEPLEEQQLTALAADLVERPEGRRGKGRRSWATSLGLAQQPCRNPQAPADLEAS